MKLALVISSLWGGGAERVASVLANHWQDTGRRVLLVTFERHASDYALDRRIERVSLDMMEESRGWLTALVNNWRRLRALRAVLRGSGADALVSFEDRMNVLVLLATSGIAIRRIVSERTDPREHDVPAIWTLLRRLAYPVADVLVVQTETLRPWARRVMFRSKAVSVIPNPVRSMHAFRSVAREQTIVGVGRLVPGKRFDLLMRACAEIFERHPSWRLVLVGDGPEREALRELADALGIANRTTITGWLDEPGEIMARSGIFVLSSRYEGFPNALLEAMACGSPVIATACTGASDIVTNEVDGLLIPVDSVAELNTALERLVGDEALRRTFGERAIAAAQRYTVERVVRRWDEVIASDAVASDEAPLGNPEK